MLVLQAALGERPQRLKVKQLNPETTNAQHGCEMACVTSFQGCLRVAYD